ncbi:HET-domain-containing protein [Hypoxylon rubiginosum]|uniref:HET-domain-containing protein n=1 Tax=Hypoxylon rubiginosum TaxID=110542 RepID=A0ACB9ZDN1_9PEZI|nr:HET-domain-containing protein [Hypoxylon rubiginosum]
MVQYSPLDPNRSEIRVLVLQRGKTSDPIRCTLRTVSLDSPPYFEALSYVWGDMSVKKPITVDGEEFQVTVNLESALRALRRPFRQRTLWVDAVCINQDDIPEKNVQVPQMGRLYGSAGSVLVWLGPSDLNIQTAVSWAQTYIAKKYTSSSAYWLKLDVRAKFSESAKHEKGRASLQALEGYLDLLGLPYWNRMWTFQEFCLPDEEPICYCGDVAFRATTIQAAQAAILQAGIGFLDQLMETSAREWSQLSDEEKEERSKIKSRIESKCQVVLGNMLPPLHKMRNDWRGAENPLLYLTGTTAERNCYDKRDKVYALYGMAPAIQQVYPPDYAKPVKDVVLETTAYMINHEQAPVIWAFFELRPDRLSDTSYPSWVPDFAVVSPNTPSRGAGVADSLRRSEDAPPAKVDADLSTAHLWARSLGTCKVVLKFDSLASNVLINQFCGLLKKGPSQALESDVGKSIRNPDTLTPRMARAFVAHHVRQHEYSTEEILNTFDLIFDFNTPSRPIGNHCWAMIEDVAEDLRGKTLFVTAGGCFGIGVGDIKDGDLVTIPPQTRAPMVLTRESNISTNGAEYYRIVGTAYVDGIMKGEFLDADLAVTIEKQELEELLIH